MTISAEHQNTHIYLKQLREDTELCKKYPELADDHTKLLPHEAGMIHNIENGEYCAQDFRGLEIRADVIRAVMFGVDFKFQIDNEKFEMRKIKTTLAGIQIKNATIIGQLNLQRVRDVNGSAATPLILEGCTISQNINLRWAYLRQLSLANCAITHIDGEGLHVGSTLDISGLS